MNTFDRLVMFSMAVSDMVKAKDFYTNKLGFKITADYRQNDKNWWVSLELRRLSSVGLPQLYAALEGAYASDARVNVIF